MPAELQRIARRKGARGVQTLYMIGRMQNNKRRATAMLQALD